MVGVITSLGNPYLSISQRIRFPADLSLISKDSILLLMRCIKHVGDMSARDQLVSTLQSQPWLKTSLGFKTPGESFFPAAQWESLLHVVVVPMVDVAFYSSAIHQYKAELGTIGVTVNFSTAKVRVIKRFKDRALSGCLTKENVLSLLKYCKIFSKTKYSLVEDFTSKLTSVPWLRTSQGLKSASSAILWDENWESFSHIAGLPFVDGTYYGMEIYCFKDIFGMMGVALDTGKGYMLIASKIKFPREVGTMTSEYALSLLKFIRLLNTVPYSAETLYHLIKNLRISKDQEKNLRDKPWLKTNLDFKHPSESFLPNPEWDSLLNIVDVPVIDTIFYGNRIQSFEAELQQVGVVSDFPSTSKAIAAKLKTLSSLFSLAKNNVLTLLESVKCLKRTKYSPVEDQEQPSR